MRSSLPATHPASAGVSFPAASSSTAAAMLRYLPGDTPLVLDSPHSGTHYPEDFRHACDFALLRRAEDTHVEKLYDFATALGAAWIEAHFPRAYLDANRDVLELDTTLLDAPWPGPVGSDPKAMAKVRLGKGLIWKYTDEGVPIYDRLLTVDEVSRRIERCWRPYHEAVAAAINRAYTRHGYVIHLNCHSMPSVAAAHATEYPGLRHADFVIGDRDGTTADPGIARAVCDFLKQRGYSVSYNHPYKGVELVRRHGHPASSRHSLQIEVNRKLYMDEQTLAQDPPAMARLRADLRGLAQMLLALPLRAM